jgi:hypothetical protein
MNKDSDDVKAQKKSVAEIVKEVVDDMNNPDSVDESLRRYYNRPSGCWTGD